MEISCNGKWLLKSYVFDEHMRVVVDRLGWFCVGSGEHHGGAANVPVVLNAPPNVVPTRDARSCATCGGGLPAAGRGLLFSP